MPMETDQPPRIRVNRAVLVPRWAAVLFLVLIAVSVTVNAWGLVRLVSDREANTDTLKLVEDCVKPPDEKHPVRDCYTRSREGQGQAVLAIGLISVYAVQCFQENRTDLEMCVTEKLAARGLPPVLEVPTTSTSTDTVPPPSAGAPTAATSTTRRAGTTSTEQATTSTGRPPSTTTTSCLLPPVPVPSVSLPCL